MDFSLYWTLWSLEEVMAEFTSFAYLLRLLYRMHGDLPLLFLTLRARRLTRSSFSSNPGFLRFCTRDHRPISSSCLDQTDTALSKCLLSTATSTTASSFPLSSESKQVQISAQPHAYKSLTSPPNLSIFLSPTTLLKLETNHQMPY